MLQLPGKYQQKYKKELRPEAFGFKTPNDLLKTIKQLDLHHDEMLALWFLTYNKDYVEPIEEEVMEVQEVEGDAAGAENQAEKENNGAAEPGQKQTGNGESGIIVLEESEDIEMKAPELPPPAMERPKLPDLPAPSMSVSSMASSTVSIFVFNCRILQNLQSYQSNFN